jgi:hypothetical protein
MVRLTAAAQYEVSFRLKWYGFFLNRQRLSTQITHAMKTTKGVDFVTNIQGTLYQSYRKGWITAVKNFEKNYVSLTSKDQPFFPLHNN